MLTEVEPGFTEEDGTRTFALSEIMVREDLTGQSVAHALHDELVGTRPESRATLLVEPDSTNAHRDYTRWGWQKVAQLRPNWLDEPIWDVVNPLATAANDLINAASGEARSKGRRSGVGEACAGRVGNTDRCGMPALDMPPWIAQD